MADTNIPEVAQEKELLTTAQLEAALRARAQGSYPGRR